MEERLRKSGLKVTKGRMEILKLLESSPLPLSAEEAFEKISRSSCSSLSTAYRILHQLSDKGILRSSLHQNGITYYEMNRDNHRHYIVCSSCGSIAHIEGCPMDVIHSYVEKDTGYRITGHIFELKGLCPQCLEQEK